MVPFTHDFDGNANRPDRAETDSALLRLEWTDREGLEALPVRSSAAEMNIVSCTMCDRITRCKNRYGNALPLHSLRHDLEIYVNESWDATGWDWSGQLPHGFTERSHLTDAARGHDLPTVAADAEALTKATSEE
jgi:hypothetical protein